MTRRYIDIVKNVCNAGLIHRAKPIPESPPCGGYSSGLLVDGKTHHLPSHTSYPTTRRVGSAHRKASNKNPEFDFKTPDTFGLKPRNPVQQDITNIGAHCTPYAHL